MGFMRSPAGNERAARHKFLHLKRRSSQQMEPVTSIRRRQPHPWQRVRWVAPLWLYLRSAVATGKSTHIEQVAEGAEDVIEATRAALAPVLGPALAGLRRERFDPAPEEGLILAGSGDSRTLADRGGGYRVFTTAYDTERSAAGLVRAALLSEYRERLDLAGTALGLNIGRLARELQAVLGRLAPDGWNGGAEESVLGFTTGVRNGGRALRDWRGIAALLKADLFREGIDGDAVDWACARLLARYTARRLLFAVSDVSPMDSATALANNEHYLDPHLRVVVARREVEGAVEIIGLGIGLDLAPYYRRSLALDLSKGLGRSVFFDLVRALSRPGSTLTPASQSFSSRR